MSPIDGTSDFSFSSALQYQGLSTETPQQLQTAGVIPIPDATSSTATPSASLTPSESETAELMSSMNGGSGSPSDPTELAGAYELLSTNGAQTVQVIGSTLGSIGQQVDTQV